MLVIRLMIVLGSLFTACWLATQEVAKRVQYSPLLGDPMTVDKGIKYYAPWKWFVWRGEMYQYIPNIFNSTMMYFLGAFVVCLLLLLLTRKKKKSTNYGSAEWAKYDDLLGMDLISANGVVVGLYDPPMLKTITKVVRWLDKVQKEKKAYAEMYFKEAQMERIDKVQSKIENIQARGGDASAEIAMREEIMKEKYKSDGTLKDKLTVHPFVWAFKKLNKWYSNQKHFYLRDDSNKHMAVIAPTRSGKGVGLIIPTLLGGWTSSSIVNDIKSENWEVTAGYRKSRMGHVCIKFEPTKADGTTARWNPLDEIATGTAMEESQATNIAHVLADYEGKGKLDHWGANAEMVIMTVILHLKYAHYADPEHYPFNPSLSTIANFLKANIVEEKAVDDDGNESVKVKAKGFMDTLKSLMNFQHVPPRGITVVRWDIDEHRMVEAEVDADILHELYPQYTDVYNANPFVHPLIYKNFMEITAKPENEGGSIVSTANTALKEYLDPVLAANTSKSDFCIDDVMNWEKPVDLFLVTPPSDLLRLAPIFRLFFEMMVKHHAARMGFKDGRGVDLYKHKCLFLMDEFSSLGNLQAFAATLSYIAGYGMKAFLIIQGKPQMDQIYGKDNQIFMNCHLQIIYGPNENDTAQYAAAMLGKETRVVEPPGNGFFDKLFSKGAPKQKQEIARDLMSADELKRLGDREILIASGHPPVLTDKVKYYEHKYFTSKLMASPVVSDVIWDNKYRMLDISDEEWNSKFKDASDLERSKELYKQRYNKMKGTLKNKEASDEYDFTADLDYKEDVKEEFDWKPEGFAEPKRRRRRRV